MTGHLFSRHELAAALDGGRLRALRILHSAIPGGIALFLGVVGFLAARPAQASPYPGLPWRLTLPSLVLGVAGAAAAALLPRRLLARRLAVAESPEEAVASLQRAALLRLVLLEGGSLFGIVVLLFAALDGSLVTDPFLWLNAFPAFALVAVAVLGWPERERLLDEIETAYRRAR
ncbi:MAG TPA: hypothetical protein PKX99_04595 [Thermoanaerobaculia bacterium]|nr:hypothetical protein [Thermoanaerobaculia bacterium]